MWLWLLVVHTLSSIPTRRVFPASIVRIDGLNELIPIEPGEIPDPLWMSAVGVVTELNQIAKSVTVWTSRKKSFRIALANYLLVLGKSFRLFGNALVEYSNTDVEDEWLVDYVAGYSEFLQIEDLVIYRGQDLGATLIRNQIQVLARRAINAIVRICRHRDLRAALAFLVG